MIAQNQQLVKRYLENLQYHSACDDDSRSRHPRIQTEPTRTSRCWTILARDTGWPTCTFTQFFITQNNNFYLLQRIYLDQINSKQPLVAEADQPHVHSDDCRCKRQFLWRSNAARLLRNWLKCSYLAANTVRITAGRRRLSFASELPTCVPRSQEFLQGFQYFSDTNPQSKALPQ